MVTLKEFLEIAPNIVDPAICSVMIEVQDEYYGTRMDTPLKHFASKSQLEQYYEYEIFGFDEEYSYGELEEQRISLRYQKHDWRTDNEPENCL